jgi:hypothetical protein
VIEDADRDDGEGKKGESVDKGAEHGTHVNKEEVGIPAVLCCACLHLQAERADTAHGIGRCCAVDIWGGQTEDARLIEEVVDEVHLCGRVAVGTVNIAVKRSIRHIERSLPHI